MIKENNVKISVSNYGPIAEAKDIELCPLTVFVGPSNTGKSYLAILVYALFNSFPKFRERLYSLGRRLSQAKKNFLGFDQKMIRTLSEELLSSDKEKKEFSDLSEKLKQWINLEIVKITSKKFHQEIRHCVGVSEEHATFIKDNFNLNWGDTKKSFTLRHLKKKSQIQIKKLKLFDKELTRIIRFITEEKLLSEIKDNFIAEIFFSVILGNVFDIGDKTGSGSFYLPAARTGIMQSHRAMAGALAERASLVGIEDVSVPTLSGIVSDFLREIIIMDTTEYPDKRVGRIAKEMEDDILHGSVKSETIKGGAHPQFLYKQNGLEIPLLRSSSMVSELAPIVLFLRHRVGPGDLLIIEEPESHLHPEAQRGIAKVVVDLVRAGVRVMVTTHSDYFLEQISNYVRRSKLGDAQKPDTKRSLFLKEEEVGAYVFKQHKSGTIVERLKFDKEGGLSPEDHNKVSSDLYNETVEILDHMDDK